MNKNHEYNKEYAKKMNVMLKLMEKYRPKYFLHGHVHMNYGRQHIRCDKYMDTTIYNAYERYLFEYE